MSVSITLQVDHTVLGAEDSLTYKVECEITASDGVENELFTYVTADESYSHPSTVMDLEFYPNTKAEAVTNNLDYYRQATVTREFDSMSDALTFSNVVRSRMQTLANDIPLTQGNLFVGPQTYVLTTSA